MIALLNLNVCCYLILFLGDSEFCHFYFRAPEHVDGLFAGILQ